MDQSQVETKLKGFLANPDASKLTEYLEAFHPKFPGSIHNLAFACLARLILSNKGPEQVQDALPKLLSPIFAATSVTDWHAALMMLSIILQVSPDLGASILSDESIQGNFIDGVDILIEVTFTAPPKSHDDNDDTHGYIEKTKLALADFISAAAAAKAARPIIRKLEPLGPWLSNIVTKSENVSPRLKAIATIATIKIALIKGDKSEQLQGLEGNQSPSNWPSPKDLRPLVPILSNLLLQMSLIDADTEKENENIGTENDPNLKTQATIVEGLSLLSHYPVLRRMIASTQDGGKSPLLKTLVSLAKSCNSEDIASTELQFALSSLFSSLTEYTNRLLSQEEQTRKRLQKMAVNANKKGGKEDEEDNDNDDEPDEIVDSRINILIDAGILDALSTLANSKSLNIRRVVGKTYCSIIEKNDRRGKVIQSGGAKALLKIISSITIPQKTPGSTRSQDDEPEEGQLDITSSGPDLICIQALCKLAITTDPQLLFSQPAQLFALVRPFSLAVNYHSQSNLLQQFESLMALTNLASVKNDDLQVQIAATPHFMESVQELMLSESAKGMIRCAAVQLVCNLVMCQKAFEFWGGSFIDMESNDQQHYNFYNPDKVYETRLRLLLALCSVEDKATVLAASGALATLSMSARVCDTLLSFKQSFDILKPLCEPEESTDTETKLGYKIRAQEIIGNVSLRKSQLDMVDDNKSLYGKEIHVNEWSRLYELIK